MSDDLDQMIRQAASAHLALAPARVLTSGGVATEHDHDDLVGRAMRRLDDPAYLAQLAPLDVQALEAMMTSDSDPDRTDSPRSSSSQLAAVADDSGLHDIRALAHNAKQRISRKLPAVTDTDEELWASTTGQLKAIALPEPARLVALPDVPTLASQGARAPDVMTSDRATSERGPSVGAAIDLAPSARPRKRTALWLGAGGLAAAAAAAVLVMSGGSDKSASDRQATASKDSTAEERGASRSPAMAPQAAAPAVMAADPGAGAGSGSDRVAAAAPAPMAAGGAAAGVGAPGSATERDRAAADGRAEGKVDKTEKPASSAAVGAGGATIDKPKKDEAKKDEAKAAAEAKAKAGAGAGSAAPPPPPPSGEKSIDDLLGDATGNKGGGSDAPKLEKKGLDGKDIKAGMGPIAGRAQACYDQHGVAGHVKVKATVDPSGKVTAVAATGEFAGTPTGACVAAAVKAGAKFPPWDGAPMSVNYVYTLNE